MEEDIDNPLDDELLRELGLEPRPKEAPPPPPPVKKSRPAVSPPPPVSPPPAPSPAPQVRSEDPAQFDRGLKNLTDQMPVQVVAVLGKKTLSLREVLDLKQGELFELGKLPNESLDLIANGKLVARGDLVLIDGKIGVQITQIVG